MDHTPDGMLEVIGGKVFGRRLIREGDIVLFIGDNTDLWGVIPKEWVIAHTPSDTGDLFYLYARSNPHDEIAINPMASKFRGFLKVGNILD